MLWDLFMSAMHWKFPLNFAPSELHNRAWLKVILRSEGGREKAIQYLDDIKRTREDPNTIQIGMSQALISHIQC